MTNKRIKDLEAGLKEALDKFDRLRHIVNVDNANLRALLAPPIDTSICAFDDAWIGKCTNSKPCSKHKYQKCFRCKGPATRTCDHTSAFVCGIPTCNDHPHRHRY